MNFLELGNKIRTLRKEKKLTQEQLANQAGISRVTMGKIERGEFGSVSVVIFDLIINALDYECDIKLKNGFGLMNLDEIANNE